MTSMPIYAYYAYTLSPIMPKHTCIVKPNPISKPKSLCLYVSNVGKKLDT